MTTSENTSLSRNQQHTAVTARPSTVISEEISQESDLLYVDGKKNKLFLNIDRSMLQTGSLYCWQQTGGNLCRKKSASGL